MNPKQQFKDILDVLDVEDVSPIGTSSTYDQFPVIHIRPEEDQEIAARRTLTDVVNTLQLGLQEAMEVAISTGGANNFVAAASVAKQITDTMKVLANLDKPSVKNQTNNYLVGNIDELLEKLQQRKIQNI